MDVPGGSEVEQRKKEIMKEVSEVYVFILRWVCSEC